MGRVFFRWINILGLGVAVWSLSFSLDGSGGAVAATPSREARVTEALRVCADPNNLPYSNELEEGFENKIAQLIAAELGRPVRYTWWPQTVGFVRNTLRLRRCDLIVGIGTGNEMSQNTNPYYRSVYTMVYRRDSGLRAKALSDQALKSLRFGVIAGTPPATLLAMYGLIGQVRSYHRNVDTRYFSPARQAIADVAEGKIDVALIWGPFSGYFAKRETVPLVVVPLLDENTDVRLDFMISMAVRINETEWKRQLNNILKRLQPEIDEILKDYGVPLLDRQRRLITD
ncbi:MAG: substrate-binding domain-containing protein [Nitrospinota bacterium]